MLLAGKVGANEGELSDPAVPVRRVPLVRNVRPMADMQAERAIRSIVRDARPALIHTHMAKAGAIGRLVGMVGKARPLLVHTFHGHVLSNYFSPAVEHSFIKAERWLARRTDVLIAVSDEVRDELLQLGIGNLHQYRVIPLGLELSSLMSNQPRGALRERFHLNDDIALVGCIGRLVPIKDLPALLVAIKKVTDCHLVVIGDGEERARLERLSADLGLSNRVHFTGWVADVSSALADIDVVALSSRNEGTPVALIEAAAAARPVVATDVGGVRSVVLDGRSGYVVPPDDPEAMAEALQRLLGDDEMRRAMGEVGRYEVAPRFSAERLVNDVKMLYHELLGT